MKVKDGASIEKMTLAMREGATAVEECYAAFGAECVLTSGDEPETVHRGHPVIGGIQDPHHEGKAADFRLWNVAPGSREALVRQIADTLGEPFVVLWEIGAHTLRPLAEGVWNLTCALTGVTEHVAPLPADCARCGKTIQGATPHLHVQTNRAIA
jgi:hypothetical protein